MSQQAPASSSASPGSTAGAVDISTLTSGQLRPLQQRLSSELEHLTTSHARLRSAQARFRECIRSVETGVRDQKEDAAILVPLTSSLYVPGRLASRETVIVDVGTGFYVEKSTGDAIAFYNRKVTELARNLADIEKAVGAKEGNLRVVEDVLRQKVMVEQSAGGSGGG